MVQLIKSRINILVFSMFLLVIQPMTSYATTTYDLGLVSETTTIYYGSTTEYMSGYYYLDDIYSFSIASSADITFSFDYASANVGLYLYTPDFSYSDSLTEPGTLQISAGDYNLSLASDLEVSAETLTGSFTITPTAVPLPASLWLFMVGVGLIAGNLKRESLHR